MQLKNIVGGLLKSKTKQALAGLFTIAMLVPVPVFASYSFTGAWTVTQNFRDGGALLINATTSESGDHKSFTLNMGDSLTAGDTTVTLSNTGSTTTGSTDVSLAVL